MRAHWRKRFFQMLLVSSFGLAAQQVETVALQCDPIACATQCGFNRGLCTGQYGIIVDDCTGNCLGEGNHNDCDQDECDYCLTCDLSG